MCIRDSFPADVRRQSGKTEYTKRVPHDYPSIFKNTPALQMCIRDRAYTADADPDAVAEIAERLRIPDDRV